MDDNYFHGLIGGEVKVCGRLLVNLSLWHLSILEAIESPILSGEPVEVRDMLILIKVLKSEHPREPRLTPTIRDVWWAWKLERKPELARREVTKLKEWFNVQMACPVLYSRMTKNIQKSTSAPSLLSLVCGLVMKSNEKLTDVWNMRLSAARWYDVAMAEQDGADLTISYEGEEMAPETPTGQEAIDFARATLSPEDFARWNGN